MEDIYEKVSPVDVAGGLTNWTIVYEPKSTNFFKKSGPYWWHITRTGEELARTILTDNELCECYYAHYYCGEYYGEGELYPVVSAEYVEKYTLN